MIQLFLSTPPSRVATIHRSGLRLHLAGFYPRHPRGWRRIDALDKKLIGMFLSTPPSRVATQPGIYLFERTDVSIHATLAGGDQMHTHILELWLEFLSTPPSRVATNVCADFCWHGGVSIHATLAGGDTIVMKTVVQDGRCFYPRHPRGWRLSSRWEQQRFFRVSIHATLAGGDYRDPLPLGHGDRKSTRLNSSHP